MAKPATAVKTDSPQQSLPVPQVEAKEPLETFVRLRRKEGGWIVKVIHVIGDRVVKAVDHHEWDLYALTTNRLLTLAEMTQRTEDDVQALKEKAK